MCIKLVEHAKNVNKRAKKLNRSQIQWAKEIKLISNYI